MAAPRTTIWNAEPHTLAKHAILRAYLAAWFPILTRWKGRVLYYDGFAGPGRYSKGEDGSPVIALTVARDHRPAITADLDFVFVERDASRADHLEHVELPLLALPSNFHCSVRRDEFETAFGRHLDELERRLKPDTPTFAFIDPFGIDGLPFALVARLLRRQSCEVLITFMKSALNRFVEQLSSNTNILIGNPDAAKIIAGASDRLAAARTLYSQSLSRVASFVRYFEMRDENGSPIYDLFFATNNPLGHVRMKEAMWKTDTDGLYRFSDGVDPAQATLFKGEHDRKLGAELLRTFGPALKTWTPVERIKAYVRDKTAYIDRHTTAALSRLEDNAIDGSYRMEVAETKEDGTRRQRKHTFPAGVRIRFLPVAEEQ